MTVENIYIRKRLFLSDFVCELAIALTFENFASDDDDFGGGAGSAWVSVTTTPTNFSQVTLT
jgi:hypothetical protein